MRPPLTILDQFGALFLRLHRLADRRMTESGASLARTKVLILIDREGSVRAIDIADTLGLAPRTVTEMLDRLERDGLIRRARDDKDRRAKRVTITEAGRSAIAATEPLRLALTSQIFGSLTEAERQQFGSIIQKLLDAVADAEMETCRSR